MADGLNNCVCLAKEYMTPLSPEVYYFDTGVLLIGTTDVTIKTFTFSAMLLFIGFIIHETAGTGKGVIVHGQILKGNTRINVVSVYKDRNTDYELSAGADRFHMGRYFQFYKDNKLVLKLVPLTADTYRVIGCYGYIR